MRQFASTVKKNAIEKRRNIRVTVCECFSHLILFVILLLGFGLSKNLYFQPENFIKLNVFVPPKIFRSTNALALSPTRAPTSSGSQPPVASTGGRRTSPNPMISYGLTFEGAKAQLKGPIPIPSFDVYVTATKLIAASAASNPRSVRLLRQTSQGMRFGNLLEVGDLHFCPYPSAEVDSLVRYLNATTKTFKTLKSHFHATESDGVDYILSHLERRALALINIREISPNKIDYVIRQNSSTLPNTNQIFIAITRGLNVDYQSYLLSGFLTLERTIDKWALNYSVQKVNPASRCISPEVLTVPFPVYEYNSNPFYAQVGFLLGLAMTMSTLYPVSRLIKTIVEEKETRMREVMKIMGLNQTAHQLSWLFTAFIVFFWMSVSSTFIAHISFLPFTNLGILFVYFFLFHMSEITLCMLISVFFSNSKLAAIVGPVVLFVTILPKYIFFGSNSNEATTLKTAASLLSPTAFTFGADIIAAYEYSAAGVQYSNIRDNYFSMITVFQMMTIDIFIYGFLAWYLDQTIPHEVGTPKHPLFLFHPFYWFPSLKKVPMCNPQRNLPATSLPREMITRGVTVYPIVDVIPSSVAPPKSADFELFGRSQISLTRSSGEPSKYAEAQTGPGMKGTSASEHAISIYPVEKDIPTYQNTAFERATRNGDGDIEVLSADLLDRIKVISSGLQKTYPNGKVAVKNFTLAMLEGQITCLLGHNGAGKSSVISMITGMTTITGGQCSVYDQPLPDALATVRTMTGICPQQNVLFPSLTVVEHLRYFGCIKGLYGQKLTDEVLQMTTDIGLLAKKDAPAASLSGGMKRKLQLAIALIGGSKFLILDEPTSGMDPFSRRATWELLQRRKAGRVIVLTTHFLEEADILGDRIAIMSEGTVRTSGSSLYLKNRFGAGYLLSVSISRQKSKGITGTENNSLENSEVDSTISHGTNDESENIEDVVKSFVPSAYVKSKAAGEIIFSLSMESVPNFAGLFYALKQKTAILGIESYGVSLTSLEQVFIKLAHEVDNSQVSKSKSIYSKAGKVWQNVTRNPMRILARRGSRRTQPETESDRKIQSGQSQYIRSESEGKSQDHSVNDTNDSVSSESRKANPLMESNMDLTTCTDNYSEDGALNSSVRTTSLPKLVSILPVSITAPSIAKKYDEPTAPYDNEHSSHGSTSFRTHESDRSQGQNNERDEPEDAHGANEDKVYVATTRTQAVELLKKRLITSSRDLKGLFFQVIFPAIQILAILAILTIDLSPASRSVVMNASIFDFAPATIVGGAARNSAFAKDLSGSRMALSRYNATTSQELSVDLLQTGNKYFAGAAALRKSFPPSGRRLGAIVFEDKLQMKLEVDWSWVKTNLAFFLENASLLETLLPSIGLSGDYFTKPQTIYIPASFISEFLNQQRVNPSNTADRISNLKDLIRATSRAANLNISAVNVFLNSTEFNSLNITGAVDANSKQSATIQFDRLDSDRAGITLRNVKVGSMGEKVNVGDLRLKTTVIRSFLPDHLIKYTVYIPSSVTVLHNSTSPHGIAAFRGEVISAAWQNCYDSLNVSQSQRNLQPKVDYLARNHPLPLTNMQSLENRVILSLLASLFILVPLCYIPASFITFVVRERMSKAKHLQLVSSVSPYLYWITTYVWDMGLFLILILLIIAAFFVYGKTAAEIFISVTEATFAVFLLLLTYGMSILPLCYLYSMNFENHSTAQISIMALNFATGFVAVLAYFVMNSVPLTKYAASILVHFFRFFPTYNIGEGLISVTAAFYENTILGGNVSYFAFDVAGQNILFMTLEAFGYFAMVLITETPTYRGAIFWLERQRALLALKKSVMESTDSNGNIIPILQDEDVQVEEDFISKAVDKSEFALCIENLVKIYPSKYLGGKAKHAVRGLSLGCHIGERFGLLGVNGAGKSSTLNVLTGDIAPTRGEIYIAGMPLSDPKTRQAIGYCPQTDPLFDLMTARETLWFYGRIRGIDKEILQLKVTRLIKQVGLENFADRTSGTYSGGNKRKLSLAVSLIGSPKVLLLDEPSSGMDAFARRQMWDVIAAIGEKRSVILTTHSMEECEALCTRIGIMVDGRLKCLGPSSHLKDKFGDGYQIEVRFRSEDRYVECMKIMRGICEEIEIDERHGQFLRLKVPALDLSFAFKALEESKMSESGCIVDYTVSQNTLEQVFMKFARTQEEVEGVEINTGKI